MIKGDEGNLFGGEGSLNIGGNVTDYYPSYEGSEGGSAPLTVDPDGNLRIRGAILTDEGGFRTNFANTSLAVDIGTCQFVNGSNIVLGDGFLSVDLHVGDYVWGASDTSSAAVQVASFTNTEIILVDVYTGTTQSSVSGYRQFMKSFEEAGTTISIGSSTCTIATGTTANSKVGIKRLLDIMPISLSTRLTLSNRIANQSTYFGVYDDALIRKYFCFFLFDGTTNTSVKCVSGRNPTQAPSAAETQTTSITVTATSTAQEYRIEVFPDRVAFYVADILKATHKISLPHPADIFTAGIFSENASTAPLSSINIISDFIQSRNFNGVDTVPVATFSQGVACDNAASLLATVNIAAAQTLATLTTLANGQTAHSAAATGSPLRIGGKVKTTADVSLVDNDATDIFATTNGAMLVKTNQVPELTWQYGSITPITTNITTALKALSATLRNYVTGISISNASAVATVVSIQDGTTVIWAINVPANQAPFSIKFDTPLRGTINTAMNFVTATTGASIIVAAQGYQAL